MNNLLLEYLEKPELYAKSSSPFWEDEYISAQMLEAHLSQDTDAASRRTDYISRSVEWICSAAPPEKYPRLLDLGCGPGLYCEQFCKQGYQTAGYDISKRSIDYAKKSAAEKQLAIRYEQKDYLSLAEDEQYDLCTMIYCDYGALSTQDRQSVLSKIRGLLKPDGLFVFDVFTPAHYKDFAPSRTWELSEENGFWKKEAYAELCETLEYGANVHLHRHIILTADECSHYLIWDTVFDEKSIAAELKENGFEAVAVCGDVCGAKYTPESSTMAVVCRMIS